MRGAYLHTVYMDSRHIRYHGNVVFVGAPQASNTKKKAEASCSDSSRKAKDGVRVLNNILGQIWYR